MNGQLAELHLLAPLLITVAGAFLVLLGEVFFPRDWPARTVSGGALVLALAASAALLAGGAPSGALLQNALFADPLACAFNLIILGAALLALFFNGAREPIEAPGEYCALLLMASFGAMLFAAAADLVVLFIALETMSLSLYALCGAKRDSQRSAEAAVKYFLLGSFSSVVLLYGLAVLYGLTGSTHYDGIAQALPAAQAAPLKLALAFVLIGFLFKIALVPFHFWAPDVYDGAPAPVTAFMACAVKAAAFAALLRMLWVVFETRQDMWTPVVWWAALLTVVIGNVIALRQSSVKRMLAYSSISHAGYLSMAVLAPGRAGGGGSAILFYLLVYAVMTMGAFAVVQLLSGDGPEPDDIGRFRGLGDRNPVLAGVMTLFLLSLAGLPPGLGGLIGKFYVFNALVRADYIGLAVAGILCAVVACAYYLRVVVAMYFREPAEGAEVVAVPATTMIMLLVCAAAVVLLGVFPSTVYGPIRAVIGG